MAACSSRRTVMLASLCAAILLVVVVHTTALLLTSQSAAERQPQPGESASGSVARRSLAAAPQAAPVGPEQPGLEPPARRPLYPRLVTYAHGCCRAAKARCCESALRHGFRSCQAHGMQDLAVGALSPAGRDILAGAYGPRGAGFWIWKPLLILQALQEAEDGDIIMYADAATEFVSNAAPLLALAGAVGPNGTQQIMAAAADGGGGQDVVGFELACHGCRESAYTKPDAFVLLPVGDADARRLSASQQVLASYIVFRRSWTSIGFVSQWLAYAQDPRALTDLPSSLRGPAPPLAAPASQQARASRGKRRHRRPSTAPGQGAQAASDAAQGAALEGSGAESEPLNLPSDAARSLAATIASDGAAASQPGRRRAGARLRNGGAGAQLQLSSNGTVRRAPGAFRDHRHDQSLFSLLYKAWGFQAHPLPSQFGARLARPYPQVILHHRDLS